MLFAIVAVGAVLTFSSCSKEDNKEPNLNVIFEMSHDPITIGMGTLTLFGGHIILHKIDFEAMQDTSELVIEHEQVTTIDLITGDVTPSLHLDIPAGYYKEIDLEVKIDANDADPVIFVSANYSNSSGAVTPVRFEFRENIEMEVEGENYNFELDTNPVAAIQFNPEIWFSLVTEEMLNNAEVTNGTIVISHISNIEIYNKIIEKLDEALDLEFD